MDKFYELEFKYDATKVKLQNFITLISSLKPKKKKNVSSWDTYYTKTNDSTEFFRFRDSDSPELTKKRKTKTSNNWQRLESDLPLDPKRISEDIVTFHVGLDGYTKNFKIFKTCFIFLFDFINIVYYTTYSEDMHELGRFIEIEVNKSKVAKLGGAEKAFKYLKKKEKILHKLGLTPKNRLKKSLFELYKV